MADSATHSEKHFQNMFICLPLEWNYDLLAQRIGVKNIKSLMINSNLLEVIFYLQPHHSRKSM